MISHLCGSVDYIDTRRDVGTLCGCRSAAIARVVYPWARGAGVGVPKGKKGSIKLLKLNI